MHRAQAAALAAASPGVECGSVDAAARKVITDAGYGPDYNILLIAWATALAWTAMSGHIWFAAIPPARSPT